MARRVLLMAIFLGLATGGFAQKKDPTKEKKSHFPAWVAQARYVYVTTIYGDEFDPRVPPEDRKAVGDVQDALKEWGRFALAYRPADADLIFVIRRGKIGSAMVGGTVGTDTRAGTHGGTLVGLEAGTPQDALLIYDARLGTDTPALLKYTDTGGLDAPDLKLVSEFRKEVEEAAAARKKP